MNIAKQLYDLPFDQFSRQIQVKNMLEVLRNPADQFKIIDVGGYKGATKFVQDKDAVTVLDVFDVEEEGYIKGDGTKMPFKDGEFDFALSFDVLEHIDKKSRSNFLKESSRIASKGVIAAFPVHTKPNEYAEESLNNYYKSLHGEDHRWLREHIDYSLPEDERVEKTFKSLGLHTVELSSNSTDMWLLMQGNIFLTSKYLEVAGESMAVLNRFYNEYLGAFDVTDDVNAYRRIIVGLKNKKDYEKIIAWKNNLKRHTFTEKMAVIEQINLFHAKTMAYLEKDNRKLLRDLKRAQRAYRKEQKNNTELLGALEEIRGSKSFTIAKRLSSTKKHMKKIVRG